MTKQLDDLSEDVRAALLDVNMLSEIPEKKRTPDQQEDLENAQGFLLDSAPEIVDAITSRVFQEIVFVGEGDVECVVRWDAALRSPVAQPPPLPNGQTLNEADFSDMFRQIYSGSNTVAGLYEETNALLKNWDEAMDRVEKMCRTIWGFDKLDKAKTLFEAMIPHTVATNLRRLKEYNERFYRRVEQFKQSGITLSLLKQVNLGTPNNPQRVYEVDKGTSGFTRPAVESPFPKRPRLAA